MSAISTLSDNEVTPHVADVFATAKAAMGKVPTPTGSLPMHRQRSTSIPVARVFCATASFPPRRRSKSLSLSSR